MYKHILLATDGSELAERAMADGVGLAKALGAKVTAITVIKPWHTVAPGEIMVAFPEADYMKGAEAQAKQYLEKAEALAKEAGVACVTRQAVAEEAWKAIAEAAVDAGCDLIVMGSHGRTGLAKLVLGSETQKVLAHSNIPILVHR